MSNKLLPENFEELLPERLLKLNSEQRTVALKWESERKKRAEIIDNFKNSEKNDVFGLLDLLAEYSPDRCEHDRAIMGTCSGCDEIERILYPEAFEEENE